MAVVMSTASSLLNNIFFNFAVKLTVQIKDSWTRKVQTYVKTLPIQQQLKKISREQLQILAIELANERILVLIHQFTNLKSEPNKFKMQLMIRLYCEALGLIKQLHVRSFKILESHNYLNGISVLFSFMNECSPHYSLLLLESFAFSQTDELEIELKKKFSKVNIDFWQQNSAPQLIEKSQKLKNLTKHQ
jgi:hypothetical protein